MRQTKGALPRTAPAETGTPAVVSATNTPKKKTDQKSVKTPGFSTTSRLKRAGGSLVLTVPAAARSMLGLTEGQEMIVSVRGGQVIAEPVMGAAKTMKVRAPKYSLDDLLDGYEADGPRSPAEQAWIDAPPAGREIW